MKLFKRNKKVNFELNAHIEPVHPEINACAVAAAPSHEPPAPLHLVGEPLLPPPARRGIGRIIFDENELALLIKAYGNEDNAIAAMRYLNEDAPPEMQILAIQAMANISRDFRIKSINADGFNSHGAHFPIAGMDDSTKALYADLYGEAGPAYVDVFRASPKEISVISRLIAYSGKDE